MYILLYSSLIQYLSIYLLFESQDKLNKIENDR